MINSLVSDSLVEGQECPFENFGEMLLIQSLPHVIVPFVPLTTFISLALEYS